MCYIIRSYHLLATAAILSHDNQVAYEYNVLINQIRTGVYYELLGPQSV